MLGHIKKLVDDHQKKKKNGSGRFSGSGADDHQLFFFILPHLALFVQLFSGFW